MPRRQPLPKYEGDPEEGADDVQASAAEEDELADDEVEPYKPPSFLEALRLSRPRTRPARPRAQPATGTEADAKRVNLIDNRERMIAGFLGIFQFVLAVAFYFELRRLVVKPSKHLKITAAQARLDTLNDHHLAPYFLVVNLILGAGILGAVFSRRRAMVGLTVILAGFGLLSYGGGILGVFYLVAGGWLIFRAMKRNPRNAAAAAARGARRAPAGRAAAATAATGSGKIEADRRELAAASARTAAAVRKPPPPSKRYTPPRQRSSASKASTNSEPEKGSRLTSWLRR